MSVAFPSLGRVTLYPKLVMASYDIPERNKSVGIVGGDSLLHAPVGTDAVLKEFASGTSPR